MCIISIFDFSILGSALAGSRTLHPRRGIVGKDSRRSTFSHAYSGIASSSEKRMLAIQRLGDGRRYLFTTCSGEWWRSYRNAFQLAEEVRGMRRLVVTAWLPYHRIAILMIVPQRVVAPRSWSGSGIDADIVTTRALYHFLTPVAEHIALETRC